MTTELELIYTIMETVSAGKINLDISKNERLLRAYLRSHRGKHLYKEYRKGAGLPDEVFQDLGDIAFTVRDGHYVSREQLPKIIYFESNFGISLSFEGHPISVLNREEFENNRRNKFGKYHPSAKVDRNLLWLYIGMEQDCSIGGAVFSEHNRIVERLRASLISINESENNSRIRLKAVLSNPDDQPGYDFTKSPYPMTDELIEDLINSVNARDFNIFLRTRADEVGNKRDNTATYASQEEI